MTRNTLIAASAIALVLVIAPLAQADLVSYWQFEDNAVDSVSAHNGTLVGGTTDYTDGKFGQAVYVASGVGNYVDVANSTDFNVGSAMTLSVWADVTSGANSMGLVTRDEGSSYRYMIYISSGGGLYAYLRDTANAVVSAGSTNTTWRSNPGFQMVTMTYDASLESSRLRIYLNGQLWGEADGTGRDVSAGSVGLDIGRWNNAQNAGDRVVDDVALFNHAYTAAEVLASYNLANAEELAYDTGDSWSLIEAFRSAEDATVNGRVWQFANGLAAGTAGAVVQDGPSYTVYLTETTGMTSVATPTPEPTTLALLAIGGVAAVAGTARRRRLA